MKVGREIQKLAKKPLEGIRYIPMDEDSMAEIHCEIAGPVGTPYEGGSFRMKLVLTEGFPQNPPKGQCSVLQLQEEENSWLTIHHFPSQVISLQKSTTLISLQMETFA
jgi:ubiquitin-protein ligase